MSQVVQSQRPLLVGVDLGGTNIKIGLVDDAGHCLARTSIPTQSSLGPESGARRIGEAVLQLLQAAGVPTERVARVGLATPGTMDIPKGMLVQPHNLPGWSNFPIRDRIQHHCGLPVTFANDANAACYGEYWCGSGRNLASMIFLTLGTGVGGGIQIGDFAIVGEHSAGAECGHIIIDSTPAARICPCGRAGHLEAYASGTAVIARTTEAIAAGAIGTLADDVRSGTKLTPLLVSRHADAGDPFALEIVMETARYLGIGIVTLIHTIDPAGVVLGGAMDFGGATSPLGQQFLERIRQEVLARALATTTQNLSIVFASLGSEAGFIGAAGLARAEHQTLR